MRAGSYSSNSKFTTAKLPGLTPFALLFFVFLSTAGIKGCDEDVNLDPKQRSGSSSSSSTTTVTTLSGGSGSSTSTTSTSTTTTTTTLTPTAASGLTDDGDFIDMSGGDTSDPSEEEILDELGGLPDGLEKNSLIGIKSKKVVEVDPNDPDRDGLPNSEEEAAQSNPVMPDSDNDGYIDGFEVESGFSPTDSTNFPNSDDRLTIAPQLNSLTPRPSTLDADGDGLPDAKEAELNTSSTTVDSDGDGVPDGIEVLNGTDPLVPMAEGQGSIDSDGDGMWDVIEMHYGTDPGKADTDGDALVDSYEIFFSTDTRNPDTDGDGLVDGWERIPGKYRLAPGLFDFSNR